MKAFLLAAGVGSRLKPITDNLPKCLVPIDGQAILSIWFELLVEAGVKQVLVNTHHHAGVVESFVADHRPSGLDVSLVHEQVLLGSAGTVKRNRDFIGGDPEFMVIYSDNLTSTSLRDLQAYHHEKNAEFTMGLFRASNPSECGIASLDGDGRIIAFEEKPKVPASNLANAGIYVMKNHILDLIPDKPVSDFGYDVIPRLVGRMHGYLIPGYYQDIGTLERLDKARLDWSRLKKPV